MVYMLVAVGGALGALTRFFAALIVLPGSGFPWPTLVVNGLGCLIIGMLWGAAAESAWFMNWGRPLLLVGYLGSLTTFSTFSLETLRLFQDDRFLAAIGYIAGSLSLCLVLVAAGYFLLRGLLGTQ